MLYRGFTAGAIWGVVVLAVVALLTLSGSATAASACRKASGKFTQQAVTGPECLSPVGFCATGTYGGDIKGTSTFVGTSLNPTADTPATGVVLVTGDNTISTARGDLLTKDAIALKTSGDGEFAEVDVVIGGTGAFAGFSGTLTGTGTFSGGSGVGDYSGQICSP